jgi:tight adherence protein C
MSFIILNVIIFVAVVSLVVGLVTLFGRRVNLEARLGSATALKATSSDGSLRANARKSIWSKLIEQIESRGLSLQDSKQNLTRKKLIKAGFTHPDAPRIYMLIRIVMTLVLPLLFISFYLSSAPQISALKLYLGASFFALFGLYLPTLFLQARADRREEELFRGFPDALDLMLVCVEAGLGLDACFNRVGAEIGQSHPLLAEQFAIVSLELRAGRSREDALRNLADRTDSIEIRAFSTLLIQSEKLGSSIAKTLKVYASEMRERRRMRAEEKAHRLPVLLTLPLVLFILPTMIGVLMLPGAIQISKDLMPALRSK